tara:strand:- start:172 stop:342 length:171 start_codon:yes stop_codon:yes gene_type:complete
MNDHKVKILTEALQEICDVAKVSEGGEFYIMLAEKALGKINDYDRQVERQLRDLYS